MGGETFENMVKLVTSKEKRDKTISYYELLTMIKEKNAPKKIRYEDGYGVHIYDYYEKDCKYIAEGEGYYIALNIDLKDMLENNIEIIENSKKLEKLDIPKQQVTIANHYSKDNIRYIVIEFYRRYSVLINKINEIIEVLNEEKEVQNNKK